jgi:phage baseplate assembly protein gpV
MADGLYMGGVLNAQPTQFIRFGADGIEIHAASGKDLTIAATNINITGDVAVTGKITASGEVKGNGKNLSTHTHGGVTVGAGVTGLPT